MTAQLDLFTWPPFPGLAVAPCECAATDPEHCICGPFLSDVEDDDHDDL